MANSDLMVEQISQSLQGWEIDVIVSGSIGAVESPRFLRSLRRLGASVYPVLSKAAQLFTTETAVSWAAAQKVTTSFSALASHIAVRDACLITPASANIISKLAQGITDSPASALAASYLGSGKPLIILPNMHDSLKNSPFVLENFKRLQEYCSFIPARQEEGKLKFPAPHVLADEVSHLLNQRKGRKVMVAMGTTRGYIDDIRYISNYSSGALGSKISEELYRNGFTTEVVLGPCLVHPTCYSRLHHIETNDQLKAKSQQLVDESDCDVIFATSVLDYVPAKKQQGKIKSDTDLHVDFIKTEKILAGLNPTKGRKVGFKLESSLDEPGAAAIAKDYMNRYHLDFMVLNALKAVDQQRHAAFIFQKKAADISFLGLLESKQRIAQEITRFLG